MRINRLFREIAVAWKTLVNLRDGLDEQKISEAVSPIWEIKRFGVLENIQIAELKVFSQFGEDGIIQYLVEKTAIRAHEKSFVEFGVEDYVESSTRLLLMKDNWRGLVMDGSQPNVQRIHDWRSFWRFDLTAKTAFITTENIAQLISDAGFAKDLGLLSIDIDGNDYWVWEKLTIDPVIVIVEYNSVFGPARAVAVPYDPNFHRTSVHFSNLYWGSSLKALVQLAEKKGYALVGSNSAGNNAFFVRKDRLGGMKALSAEEAHVVSRFRESRDREGKQTYLTGRARAELIADMPVIDLETGRRVTVGDAVL